jgi:hypothetical protein
LKKDFIRVTCAKPTRVGRAEPQSGPRVLSSESVKTRLLLLRLNSLNKLLKLRRFNKQPSTAIISKSTSLKHNYLDAPLMWPIHDSPLLPSMTSKLGTFEPSYLNTISVMPTHNKTPHSPINKSSTFTHEYPNATLILMNEQQKNAALEQQLNQDRSTLADMTQKFNDRSDRLTYLES